MLGELCGDVERRPITVVRTPSPASRPPKATPPGARSRSGPGPRPPLSITTRDSLAPVASSAAMATRSTMARMRPPRWGSVTSRVSLLVGGVEVVVPDRSATTYLPPGEATRRLRDVDQRARVGLGVAEAVLFVSSLIGLALPLLTIVPSRSRPHCGPYVSSRPTNPRPRSSPAAKMDPQNCATPRRSRGRVLLGGPSRSRRRRNVHGHRVGIARSDKPRWTASPSLTARLALTPVHDIFDINRLLEMRAARTPSPMPPMPTAARPGRNRA